MMDLEALKRKAWAEHCGPHIDNQEPSYAAGYSNGFDDAVRELQPELTRLREIEKRLIAAMKARNLPENNEAELQRVLLREILSPFGEAPPVVSPTEQQKCDECGKPLDEGSEDGCCSDCVLYLKSLASQYDGDAV